MVPFVTSVEIINSGISCTASSWHASGSWWSSCLLIDSHHYWVEFLFELFLLSIDGVSISITVTFEPLETILRPVFDVSLFLISEFSLKFFFIESIFHLEAIVFESILSFNLGSHELIFCLVLLGITNHLFDLLL